MNKTREPKNMAISVRDRLKSIQRRTGQDFNTLLVRYGIERFLFRLSCSNYRNRFVLKGALLFAVWHELPHRITRDLDLLGFGDASLENIKEIFQALCHEPVEEDGILFNPASVQVEPIRAQELYVGCRVTLQGRIGNARIPVQIDVGFGDATAVDPVEIKFPSLIGMGAPSIRAYRMESALAEKFEAIVTLGMLNSRMKDYFDVWFLGKHFSFNGQALVDSIRATFRRRGTVLTKNLPVGFTESFWGDPGRENLWRAFWKKSVKTEPMLSLKETASFAASFLGPPAIAAAEENEFSCRWPSGGLWE
ncbi:MAG TPA: nucleotidyl transferase AbiEii/AbiGii toxin family protein [Chthoniobacteraceae bacterium]|nr:nucleotidyl transferase AbiEii/AbiGii toxin family protein [Chthoniobacteraceae bacterium]